MINRILCAIFGHEWYGAGWLGGTTIGDKMINRCGCRRCGIYVNFMEPMWHLRARYSKYIYSYDAPFKFPDKFKVDDPNYDDHLDIINKKYRIEILAKIHNTTIKELKKIGYE